MQLSWHKGYADLWRGPRGRRGVVPPYSTATHSTAAAVTQARAAAPPAAAEALAVA